jgi:hypothetical protein
MSAPLDDQRSLVLGVVLVDASCKQQLSGPNSKHSRSEAEAFLHRPEFLGGRDVDAER